MPIMLKKEVKNNVCVFYKKVMINLEVIVNILWKVWCVMILHLKEKF